MVAKAPGRPTGVMFGKQTAAKLYRMAAKSEGPYVPSAVELGSGAGGESDAGRFILLETPAGGSSGATGGPMTADAQIVQEDDPSIEIAALVTLFLNFDMFGDLVDGDYGQAVKDARGKWIALNAPCTAPGSG